MKQSRRKFVRTATGLLVPTGMFGIAGIIRAGTAPSLNVAGTVRVNSLTVAGGGGGEPSGTDWVTSGAGSTLRSDFTGYVGGGFTVGGSGITVKGLARWVVSGNSGSHTVKIRRNSDNNLMCSATINTSGATPGAYKWASVADTALAASTLYIIYSDETNGGDQWYEEHVISVTSAATVEWSRYSTDEVSFGSATSGRMYVPVNFRYV